MDYQILRDHDADYHYVRLYETAEQAEVQLKKLGIINADAKVSFVDDAFHSEYLRISASDVNEFNIRRFPQLGAEPKFSTIEKPPLRI